jgi:hypothetical protein
MGRDRVVDGFLRSVGFAFAEDAISAAIAPL